MGRSLSSQNSIRYEMNGRLYRKNGPCEIHPNGDILWKDEDEFGIVKPNTLYCMSASGATFWFNDSNGLCRALPWEEPLISEIPVNVILHDSD